MLRNQVTLVGQLGNDARITTFENGAIVARFNMEINKKQTKADDSTEVEKMFYRLFAWGNTAQFVNNYCRKGNKVAVTGKLVNRTYVDEHGVTKRVTEVEVRQVVKF